MRCKVQIVRTQFSAAAKGAAKTSMPFACTLGFIGLFSQNPALTIAGASLLPLLVLTLWRRGEPQVLLFAIGYQWLQIFTPIIDADLKGIVIGSDFGVPQMGTAGWLGLISILLVSIGMRLGVGRGAMFERGINFEGWIEQVSVKRLFFAYLVAKIFSLFFIGVLVRLYPSGIQFFIVLKSFSSVFFFLFLWGAVRDKRFRFLAILVVALEFIQGFGGYFSGFKEVLFICLVVYYSHPGYTVKLLKPLSVVLMTAIILSGLAWQSIKPEYRWFLNRGTGQQVLLRTPEERVGFLLDKAAGITLDDLAEEVETTISRLGYLEYFGRVITLVPDRIPHQDGRLWLEVVEHIFKPRIFFPDKKAIDDSKRTNEFTRLRVAGADKGASIGLGYVTETYIDFGPVYMFIPIFLLGLFWGRCYRLFCQVSPVSLLGLGVATTFIMQFATLVETSNLKIVGGGLASILILVPVLLFAGKPIWSFLCIRRSTASRLEGAAREPAKSV